MGDPRHLEIADLCSLKPVALDTLLAEETAEWSRELAWDNTNAASLVRSLFSAGRLRGVALLERGGVAGYGYVGLEGSKGLVGGVYVRPRWRATGAESTLLLALFDRLMRTHAVSRIEAQLMLGEAAAARILERERLVTIFERSLMVLEAGTEHRAPVAPAFRIESWANDYSSQAAEIIRSAYAGNIDSRIQDRYSTTDSAARFVHQLVQFPGASFCEPASCVAFDPATGSAAGLALCARVQSGVGHIAELCIVPQARRMGLGHELLHRAIGTLRSAGAKRVSLAVTSDNEPALTLYRRFGFREMRSFHAFVWERN